jgi:hypothetical protein
LHVDWRYSKRYLWSTCGAATFLAQNLLIVACLLCLSSYELNGLHGDTPSALQQRPITAIFLRPYSRAPSSRYSFGLTAVPHHGDIPSALQPRPIMAIFLWPYSHAQSKAIFSSALWPCLTAISIFSSPHGNDRIFLCLSARIDFIPPYGDSRLTAMIEFFFASRQESISFRLTAIHASRRYRFFFTSWR